MKLKKFLLGLTLGLFVAGTVVSCSSSRGGSDNTNDGGERNTNDRGGSNNTNDRDGNAQMVHFM